MKKAITVFIFVAFITVFLLGVSFWWNKNSSAPSSSNETKTVLIVKGTTADEIAQILYEEGVIKNPLAFKIYVQFTGNSQDIQAGEYELSLNKNVKLVTAQLLKGPVGVWITIPEGFRKEQIAQKFASTFGLQGEAYDAFIEEFMISSEGKEGFLFPDTYLFPKTTSAEKVVNMMSNTYEKKITDEIQEEVSVSAYSLSQLITMASIIERETKTDTERPVVAGILWKRLEADWPLQVDASVQYGVASVNCNPVNTKCDWWPILTKSDIDADSAYNTYKNSGLPPSPIASPGISSIKAAVFPEDSDHWFYIHDSDGTIHYAETIEEHNTNIARYLGK